MNFLIIFCILKCVGLSVCFTSPIKPENVTKLITLTSFPIPIVLWHGVGDYWRNSLLNKMKSFLEDNIPGVYVKSIRIGSTDMEDLLNGYLMNVNNQVKLACESLNADVNLKNGFHGIGFSQGAQFFRAVVQRCRIPPVRNLISLGGQHQGVYGLPHCPKDNYRFCNFMRQFVSKFAYVMFLQNWIVQAEFWHDPLDENTYKTKSVFLADINNELVKNETYKANLLKINNLVLVKFANDTIVVPVDTEWFGFYIPGQSNETYKLQDSSMYTEDRIGLRTLSETGRLHFLTMNTDHMHMDWDWFLRNIIKPFLR